ncbi:unnamed protein product [Tilletia controversa]|uniref:Uncharacterized protein n=2 Tax=Tilletia TaxID=13289 RepID=A0A8X7SZY9_9BASI|nr:hypothetical protein A4X06_0g1051 [Tilletia controversa]CAD6889455.1 unnamed protein product [Tilletia caries]CAD6908007.1 unnamed protein product [Tilletia laevis]CAD6904681.1 unnamed protein product [Tilletia controversa]CAD6927124.1 unnamed protein product [Tilletia laevis]
MPDELPKIDIDTPEDLDFFVQGIRAHARSLLEQYSKEKGIASNHLPLLQRAIDQWLLNGQIQVEPNMLVNGLSFAEFARQPREMEDYDQRLEMRLQDLIHLIGDLTHKAIEYRKAVPSARVMALQRKQDLLDEIAAEEAAIEARKIQARANAGSDGDRHAHERTEEMAAALKTSMQELNDLPTSMLGRSENAAEYIEAAARVRQLFQA